MNNESQHHYDIIQFDCGPFCVRAPAKRYSQMCVVCVRVLDISIWKEEHDVNDELRLGATVHIRYHAQPSTSQIGHIHFYFAIDKFYQLPHANHFTTDCNRFFYLFFFLNTSNSPEIHKATSKCGVSDLLDLCDER